MSDQAPGLSPAEIGARLAEIAAQRDMAQNRCVVLAGRNAELLDLLRLQRAENERLNKLLNEHGGEPAASIALAGAAH